jgi:hypothetical protein
MRGNGPFINSGSECAAFARCARASETSAVQGSSGACVRDDKWLPRVVVRLSGHA